MFVRSVIEGARTDTPLAPTASRSRSRSQEQEDEEDPRIITLDPSEWHLHPVLEVLGPAGRPTPP